LGGRQVETDVSLPYTTWILVAAVGDQWDTCPTGVSAARWNTRVGHNGRLKGRLASECTRMQSAELLTGTAVMETPLLEVTVGVLSLQPLPFRELSSRSWVIGSPPERPLGIGPDSSQVLPTSLPTARTGENF